MSKLYVPKNSYSYVHLYKKINKLIADGYDPCDNYNNQELTNSFAKLCYLIKYNPNLDIILDIIYSNGEEFDDNDKLNFLWDICLKELFSDMKKSLSIEKLQEIINKTDFGEKLLVNIIESRNIKNIKYPEIFLPFRPNRSLKELECYEILYLATILIVPLTCVAYCIFFRKY